MKPVRALCPILLIDDNHEDLFLTERLLACAGITHPIVTVDGSEEALVFLRASTLTAASGLLPYAIFCDIKMPKMSGFEVLKWTRSQKALAKITFAILTGGDIAEDREKALALGADHFLVKFPTPDVFKRVVDDTG